MRTNTAQRQHIASPQQAMQQEKPTPGKTKPNQKRPDNTPSTTQDSEPQWEKHRDDRDYGANNISQCKQPPMMGEEGQITPPNIAKHRNQHPIQWKPIEKGQRYGVSQKRPMKTNQKKPGWCNHRNQWQWEGHIGFVQNTRQYQQPNQPSLQTKESGPQTKSFYRKGSPIINNVS